MSKPLSSMLFVIAVYRKFVADPSERGKGKKCQVLLWRRKLHLVLWGVTPSLRHG